MTERQPSSEHQLTMLQEAALSSLCERYEVEYHPDHYRPVFDLPPDWVAGWVGGIAQQDVRRTIYVGCSPEGEIHS
jgi:hypothetical protein